MQFFSLYIFLLNHTSGRDELMKNLFMEKVMDPKKTYHHTGTQQYIVNKSQSRSNYSQPLYDSTATNAIILSLNFFSYIYVFIDFIGMTKECLELIYGEMKEKSQHMNMWKGSRKTKSGKIQDKYLKVISQMPYNALSIFPVYC